MRIGEIALLGPERENQYKFIRAACQQIEMQSSPLLFGRIFINKELVLHLYGLCVPENELNMSWDVIAKKLLGYIVLFNWEDLKSYERVKSTVDFLTRRYDMPLLIAANVSEEMLNLPMDIINQNIDLAPQCDFTFFNVENPKSVKQVLIKLLDSVIERV